MNDQQRALLLFINERIRTTGVSPTMHEMAAAIGNKHRSGAHRYLAMLEAEGWIRRTARRKQSIEVLRMPGDTAAGTGLVREDIISRLAAELARRNASANVQPTTTTLARWVLETAEAAGFQLIDIASQPPAPTAATQAKRRPIKSRLSRETNASATSRATTYSAKSGS